MTDVSFYLSRLSGSRTKQHPESEGDARSAAIWETEGVPDGGRGVAEGF